MISKLWEHGYVNIKDNTDTGYGVTMILDSGERIELEGTDLNKVRSDAMDFICKHYFQTNPTTPKELTTTG